MRKLPTIQRAAKLRERKHLGAVLYNEVRSTGEYKVAKHFFHIKNCVREMEKLGGYLPPPGKRRVPELGLLGLENWASTSHNQQQKGLMLDLERFVLDSIIDDCPSIGKYLAPDAPVVRNMHFERAIFKLSAHREKELTCTEFRAAGTCLIVTFPADNDDDTIASAKDSDVSYLQQIEAKKTRTE